LYKTPRSALLKAKKTVVFATYSEGARDRVKTLLEDHEAPASRLISRYAEAKAGLVNLAVWPLEQGFETEGLAVVAEQDVLGDRLVRAPRRKKRGENFLSEVSSLSAGDLVVHVEHGIGRFLGLETVQALGAPHDCAMLEYAGGDKLYLPVENIELLSRYGQDAGLLDKLGGGAWQARKARMKERIREMADRLIRLAAERARSQSSPSFSASDFQRRAVA
jgi:transcription-repair coupling factor (superfamily II helicase)